MDEGGDSECRDTCQTSETCSVKGTFPHHPHVPTWSPSHVPLIHNSTCAVPYLWLIAMLFPPDSLQPTLHYVSCHTLSLTTFPPYQSELVAHPMAIWHCMAHACSLPLLNDILPDNPLYHSPAAKTCLCNQKLTDSHPASVEGDYQQSGDKQLIKQEVIGMHDASRCQDTLEFNVRHAQICIHLPWCNQPTYWWMAIEALWLWIDRDWMGTGNAPVRLPQSKFQSFVHLWLHWVYHLRFLKQSLYNFQPIHPVPHLSFQLWTGCMMN